MDIDRIHIRSKMREAIDPTLGHSPIPAVQCMIHKWSESLVTTNHTTAATDLVLSLANQCQHHSDGLFGNSRMYAGQIWLSSTMFRAQQAWPTKQRS